MNLTVFTIGHSTRSAAELINLLRENGVECLVDIRAVPRSARNPQFNSDTLPEALAEAGTAHGHMRELGGLRHHPKGPPPSPNGLWRNEPFRNFADYAMTAAFHTALDALIDQPRHQPPTLMCRA